MQLIPAIDLQQGRCVRLVQGDFSKVTYYPQSPLDLASHYHALGIDQLHIVDLDGAKAGQPQQLPLIQSLQSCGVRLQAGGGIRCLADAKACLEAGIERVVLGSIAITNVAETKAIIDYCGAKRIVLACDIRMEQAVPKLAIHGWQTTTDFSLWEWVAFYQQLHITTLLCTDITCDGMLCGPNFALYQQAITQFPAMHWQASGGIRHQQDLTQLTSIGLSAAILGRLLYETDFNWANALAGVTAC